jgi:hypothetical protein
MINKWTWLLVSVLLAAVAAMGCEKDSEEGLPPASSTDTGVTVDPGTGGTADPGTGGTQDPGTAGTEDSGVEEDTTIADEGPAADATEACLLACGDGCFKPEHEACGEAGKWWCPCEMACHGVAKAADNMTCCEPVPANCVPTCLDGKAMNCTSTTDGHGCIELEWTEEDCGEATCVADYENDLASCQATSATQKLCADTSGAWQDDACDCGEGGGWDAEKGCWAAGQALCESTGGTWQDAHCGPFCGTCDCAEGEAFDDTFGCMSTELLGCLGLCGDGCFGPDQEVCGQDGKWWCPCEMDCYEVSEAEDISTCCEPVLPGCVSSCEGNVAKRCASKTDSHGCTVLEWTSEDCGELGCDLVADTGEALCKAAALAELCTSTGGDWNAAGNACVCPEGASWFDDEGCK